MEVWRLLTDLAGAMGLRFKMKYQTASEVFAEIRRVAPIYRYVDVGSQGAEGIWDASRSPLAPAAGERRGDGAPAFTPVADRGARLPRRAIREVVRRVVCLTRLPS